MCYAWPMALPLIPMRLNGWPLTGSVALCLVACAAETGTEPDPSPSVSGELAADDPYEDPVRGDYVPPPSRMDMPEIEIAGTIYRQQLYEDVPFEGFVEPDDLFDEELSRNEEGPPPPTISVTMGSDGDSAIARYLEEGIWDDSIGARELRAEMERREDGLWYVGRMGWRQQCWRGPTPGEWVTEACP